MEVYNPDSVIQISEVLSNLTIRAGCEQIVYQGKAAVNSLVNTGLMAVVSVTLMDEWSEFHALHQDLHRVKDEAETFVREWETRFKVNRDYQILISEMRSFLAETSRWVDQAELSGSLPRGADGKLREDIFYDLATPIMNKVNEFLIRLEGEAGKVSPEESVQHRTHAQVSLHPFLLRAPFVYRTFAKPLGYAGDYEMVNQILGDPRQGPSAYFQIVNTVFLKCAVAEAHRNRIEILVKYLDNVAIEAKKLKRPVRVLNIACGPAIEIQKFITTNQNPSLIDFTLLDFNQTTLDHVQSKIDSIIKAKNLDVSTHYIHDSVQDLLKKSIRNKSVSDNEKYDFIYCAGLFDYLSDKVCSRLIEYFSNYTRSGGKILYTNVHLNNPQKNGMAHLLEWHLIYRNEESFAKLHQTIPIVKSYIYTDTTSVNIFGELTIP